LMGPSIQFINNTLVCNYPASAFQWYMNDTLIAGAVDSVYTPAVTGNYSVVVVYKGCTLPPAYRLLNITDVHSAEVNDFALFPNPNSGSFEMIYHGVKDESATITIADMNGRIISEWNVFSKPGDNSIPVQINEKGIYILTLKNGSGIMNKKVTVQ
jgi:hypothetical protein